MPDRTPEEFAALTTRIRDWVIHEAGFAQFYTVNKDGFPTGRSMGATLAPDWSVDTVQGNNSRYARGRQVQRHPQVEILWLDYRNHQGMVPRAVFLRGIAETYSGDRLIATYRAIRARLGGNTGSGHGEDRTDESVLENLIGIHVTPVRIRAEGFGDFTEVIEFTP